MLIFCGVILTSCSKDSLSEDVTSYDQVVTKKVAYDYDAIEVEILEDINLYRKANGLAELQPLTEVSIEAESHNEYMIDQGTVSHDNFSQRASFLMQELGVRSVSENVAYGYRSADAVVKAWLKSKGHKENIEADNTHFGISVRQDADGRNYFTNIFVKK
ncbi:MAG: CAP domain-containing protein [Bacteroidota bacterium]|uniref:Transporter n=1 Tax=Christiangramia flava JLT2011 TaxID=1229726 RepID=A0A1L7I9K9_9FLAO|nr:CAP domain-containing protein [Christiangramia flava]APU70301.1 Transporter [Christiangramia flava JLT2011]MEE2773189.1 CAP domain-containing protein [Bacteroidota bacterium]OSS37544.1 Transporter [Christiangramia flava JLT2011]